MKRLILVSTLFSLLLLANDSLSQNYKNWNVLNNEEYSIKYPADWQLDESHHAGTSFIILSELVSAVDPFRENINLIKQNLKGQNIDLDEFVKISKEQIQTLIIDGDIFVSQRLNKNKREYHRIIYMGKQGDFELTFEQYYWVENEVAYILTLTCEKDKFKAYQKTGELILDSFELK